MPHTHAQSVPEILPEPRIDDVLPAAALPLGEVELMGAHLGPLGNGQPTVLPSVLVDGHPAQISDKYNSMIRSSNNLRF